MPLKIFANRLLDYADKQGATEDPYWTNLPGFAVLRNRTPTVLQGMLYNPIICLVLQGHKETYVGDRKVSFGTGESLIVSHDLPVMARITEASAQTPYIALILSLDLQIIRSLYEEVDNAEMADSSVSALEAAKTDISLIGALERLFDLVDRPTEAKVMVPLVQREIHFRILMARHGGMVRQLLLRDSHASRIAKAINRIKDEYASPLAVTDLADIAGMSASSFHEHFKAVTSTTPLQYQKDIRLLQARHLIRDSGHTVSAAAFGVGYESPTQFSREYSRKFGVSPRADRMSLQAVGR